MQGIYTYIPETNHVPKEYSVAAILSLPFMVPIITSSCVGSNVLLHHHFPKYVCSAQYGIIIIIIIIIIIWYLVFPGGKATGSWR
jgi:hypothetical protein